MYQRQIMQAIAERLTVKGNCPADPGCIYAGADGCAASPDALQERLTEAESKLTENENGLVVRNTLKPSPWACDDLILVIFTDTYQNFKAKG